jgi:GLPGLI family protein
MKLYYYFFFLLSSIFGYSQINYKITYLRSSNGALVENQDPILVFSNNSQTLISSELIYQNKAQYPFEQTLINDTSYIQIANLNTIKTSCTKDSISISKQTFEFSSETKKVLGYTCKKAKTIINSNTIELWYTTDLKIKGAPTLLGQNLGLVLETIRNGNFVVSATKVEKVKQFPTITIDKTKSVSILEYKDLLWKSRFITIPIFKEEIINFS